MGIRPRPSRRSSGLCALLLLAAVAVPPTLPGQAGAAPPAASPAPPATGAAAGPMGYGSADARFIEMMIPHHDGAIAMAELAPGRARRPEILALAARIRTSQSAENATMRRWYRQWFGRDVPAWWGGPGQAAGMGMGPGMGMGMGMGMGPGMGMGMPGMGTSLEALRSAADFDRAFIEQMIPHHRMGVMMAAHAERFSTHPDLRELQAAMVRVQSREIAEMARWYRDWYAAGAAR